MYINISLSLSLSLYTYIYIYMVWYDTGVCEQNTPPNDNNNDNANIDNNTLGIISMINIQSGAGEEFLLLLYRAEAREKGKYLSQTPVCYDMVLYYMIHYAMSWICYDHIWCHILWVEHDIILFDIVCHELSIIWYDIISHTMSWTVYGIICILYYAIT